MIHWSKFRSIFDRFQFKYIEWKIQDITRDSNYSLFSKMRDKRQNWNFLMKNLNKMRVFKMHRIQHQFLWSMNYTVWLCIVIIDGQAIATNSEKQAGTFLGHWDGRGTPVIFFVHLQKVLLSVFESTWGDHANFQSFDRDPVHDYRKLSQVSSMIINNATVFWINLN